MMNIRCALGNSRHADYRKMFRKKRETALLPGDRSNDNVINFSSTRSTFIDVLRVSSVFGVCKLCI